MFIIERAVDVDNVILHWIKSQFEFMVNFESDVFIYLLILVIIENLCLKSIDIWLYLYLRP